MENKKITEIINIVKEMSLLEINDLVKAIEETFEVKAVMQVAAQSEKQDSPEKDSSTVSLILKSFGSSKITVIKAVIALLNIKLLEAKKLVEKAPVTIKEGLTPEEANEFAGKINEAGGETEIK